MEQGYLTYTLKPDNPCNTSLVDSNGNEIYAVQTAFIDKKAYTTVRAVGVVPPARRVGAGEVTVVNLNLGASGDDPAGDTIAKLEWRDVLSDRLTFMGVCANGEFLDKTISMSSWLKKSIVPFSSSVKFKDDMGRQYKWTGYGPGLRLQLYVTDEPNYKEPIAAFNRSKSTWVNGEEVPETVPATLVLAPRAQEIRHLVVLSFLFLEKSRRLNENEIVSRAAVEGMASFNINAPN